MMIGAMMVMTTFTACDQREKELEEEVKLLKEQSTDKDQEIDAFITSMGNIQSNLDSIKQLEGVISKRAMREAEDPAAEEAIIEDMQLIYERLQATRSDLEALEKDLENSSIASEKMRGLVAKLRADITEKDSEIVRLKEELAQANIYIDKLMTSVDQLALENERRIQVIRKKNEQLQEKESEMHVSYWVAGTVKELRQQNIIEKEGTFLGLGGVKVISEDLELEALTEVDQRQVTEFALNAKKAELVSPHPAGSYELVGEKKNVEKLVVTDVQLFWQQSNILIIATN